jgi:para-aminobenzoate synthetase component 1
MRGIRAQFVDHMIYPLIHEIVFDDPLSLFALFAEQNGAIFLDSAEQRKACGRYSFIAVDPYLTLRSKNAVIQSGDQTSVGDPFTVLQAEMRRFPLIKISDMPPFQGGVAGYFGYDAGQYLEALPAVFDDMEFADLFVGFYDLVIAFDHDIRRAWIFSSGYPLQESSARAVRAEERLHWLLAQLKMVTALPPVSQVGCAEADIRSNFTAEAYQDTVKKVIDYILAGDIFEANISQRFQAPLPENLSPFDLYRRLRLLNPAPFAAYVCMDDTVLASASPERFLKLRDKQVEARPIKGTRRRGSSAAEDKKLAADLLGSAKDHAENVMIVDLLRNDLSRVCRDHSVQVPQLCSLESYASVHHLVSVVSGELHEHLQAIDLLRASFPGGSITGAPKVRAMEIIAELEPTARGPYCGSVGYIGFDGDMDCSITIRTFAIKNHRVTFQAGGAIVLDSDPREEYEETKIKARALRLALLGLTTT